MLIKLHIISIENDYLFDPYFQKYSFLYFDYDLFIILNMSD